MALAHRRLGFVAALIAIAAVPATRAAVQDPADRTIEQFLAKEKAQPAYRALRRLEAKNGSRQGWMEAATEYSPETGFTYRITREGGSDYIRNKVLRAVLEGEREVISRGKAARSALEPANYRFEPNGLDGEGLARILLSPKRKERVLVAGTMFLDTNDGGLVRLQGRLAKSPSFWIKDVDILRTYDRIDGEVMPVAIETTAQVRFLGPATLRMTYNYAEVDGRAVSHIAQDVLASSNTPKSNP